MKTETKKEQKTTINVVEHSVFEGDMKTNIISSIEMADIVSSMFGPAFSDYYGCNIRVNDGHATPVVAISMPFGALYVDLYFKDRGAATGGAMKNIELRGAPKTNGDGSKPSLSDRFFQVNSTNNCTNTGRVYNVTKETYEALEEFMINGRNTRWAEHTQEIASSMSIIGSKEEVVVCISGLDLNKIITKIYGDVTDNGRYEYVATPSTLIPNKGREFIMQVCQLNKDIVSKIQHEMGIFTPNNPQFHQYNN